MFGKSKDSTEKKGGTVHSDNVLSEGTEVQGAINCIGNLTVEGRVTGNILKCSKQLTISQSGHVIAKIEAQDVIIAGKLEGDIFVKGKVTITSSGELKGNIESSSIIIQEGGSFSGATKMNIGKKLDPPASASMSAPAISSSPLDSTTSDKDKLEKEKPSKK